jgi:DNA (cytosine-5)-methyltransferase 1
MTTGPVDGFVHLKRLPFQIVFQNDILPSAKKVADLNGWSHNYTLKDIRTIDEFPQADVIIGGFPCQDFSHAGKRKGFDSQRGTLYQAYVQVVKQVKPLVFVAENVQGLLTMSGALDKIKEDFASVGYEVQHQLIQCEDFGIPQTRHRVIIMGIRLDCRDKLDDGWNVLTQNKTSCIVQHYLQHLDEPNVSLDVAQQTYSKAKRLLKGQGQNEINLHGFAPTMRAEHHGNIEFRNSQRRLTIREVALIQTFPPHCVLTEKKPCGFAYKPLGNAVPPLLAYIIANQINRILKKIKN